MDKINQEDDAARIDYVRECVGHDYEINFKVTKTVIQNDDVKYCLFLI